MAPIPPDEVPIREAATVVVARGGASFLEVLMVRRDRSASFAPGAHVFPGGAVEEIDDSQEAREVVSWSGHPEEFRWRAAGLRELFEEAGVLVGVAPIDTRLRGEAIYSAIAEIGARLDADALEYLANWVTPVGPPRRFDARFYVLAADADAVPDDGEVFEAEWVAPSEAVRRADAGEWQLEFPTRFILTTMSALESADELMRMAAETEVVPVVPRLRRDPDGSISVLLPGEDGFEAAPA